MSDCRHRQSDALTREGWWSIFPAMSTLITKAELAAIADARAIKLTADRAALAEGRICSCDGPHHSVCITRVAS